MNYENLQVNTQEGMARMLGLTFVEVTGSVGDGEMTFVTADGQRFMFAHQQDCCESVSIEDICGDLQDLVGEPLLRAEESEGLSPVEFDETEHESVTWTFYRFATRKGYVDVRWLGESNGYYSEGVDLFVEGVARVPNAENALGDLLRAKLNG